MKIFWGFSQQDEHIQTFCVALLKHYKTGSWSISIPENTLHLEIIQQLSNEMSQFSWGIQGGGVPQIQVLQVDSKPSLTLTGVEASPPERNLNLVPDVVCWESKYVFSLCECNKNKWHEERDTSVCHLLLYLTIVYRFLVTMQPRGSKEG